MSKPNPAKPDNRAPNNPAAQTDEKHGGAVKGRQVTDATMREDDLARGSEPASDFRRGG